MGISAQPARILIVDDEAANVDALCDTLRDQGYQTTGFTDSEAALGALRNNMYELLLSDLMMPAMSGIDLLRAAQQIDPNLIGIIMTGEGTIATAVEAMRSGAQDYILKPFKLSVILPVLARALTVRDLRIANVELELSVRERTAQLLAANQKEERTQAALNEKNILLAEIHHRVKNNLQIIDSLLDLEAARIQDSIALSVLRNSRSRVKSIALVHQVLYQSQDFARVDFKAFLDALMPIMIDSYALHPERTKLIINVADVSLPIAAAVPCALVITELISNALKYAFPNGAQGEISIDVSRAEHDQALLVVSDNGIGIADDVDLKGTATLGLQLIAILAEQLHGDISIQRAQPTRFELKFPLR
jgi:two-component sensor histidine kinase/CheY-like chemotaxis protein